MTEQIFTVIFAAVLGACLGSFANVMAIRMHEMVSLTGRSRCPACKKNLRPRHLIPIFSWLALRGKCADCGAKIHVQYPLVEFLAAALTVIAALRFSPFGPDVLFFGVETAISLALLVMVVMDLRWKELPLELMVGLGAIGLAFNLRSILDGGLEDIPPRLLALALAVAVPVVFFGGQWLLSQGAWLGSGDVWFGAMMALLLGTWAQTLIAMYLAYIVGGLVVMFLFATKRVRRGMRVPFAPALALGLLLAMWFGGAIENWIAYAF